MATPPTPSSFGIGIDFIGDADHLFQPFRGRLFLGSRLLGETNKLVRANPFSGHERLVGADIVTFKHFSLG